MKRKIIDLLNKFTAPFILFAAWLGVTIPNLKIYWMMVDDGHDVIFARTLFEKLSEFNINGFITQLFEGVGRFRPVYWFYHMWVWLIGGNSYQFHHFAHMLVIGSTCLFIYLILNKLTRSKIVSLFGGLSYLLIPLNIENVLRLGPQEPLLALFLSVSFYLIISSKNNLLLYILIFVSFFTKETTIAILPVIVLYYLYSKTNFLNNVGKKGISLLVVTTVATLMTLFIVQLNKGGYSGNYQIDFAQILKNLVFYYNQLSSNTLFLFPLLIVVFLVRVVINSLVRKKLYLTEYDSYESLFLLGSLSFLLIQLPWKYAIGRYLMVCLLFLVVFILLELWKDLQLLLKIKFLGKYKLLTSTILIVVGFYSLCLWSFQLIYSEFSAASTPEYFKVISLSPKNTTLLINVIDNDATMELVYETKIQLSEFWKRPDITVEYLDFNKIPKNSSYLIVDSDQFLRNYKQYLLDEKFGKPDISIRESTSNFVLTTPVGLVGQLLKKSINYLVYKTPITQEGIIEYYNTNSSLYFYTNYEK